MVLLTKAKITEGSAVVFPTITKISEYSTTVNRKYNNGLPNTSEDYVNNEQCFSEHNRSLPKALILNDNETKFLPS
jgi:hypothetical protein